MYVIDNENTKLCVDTPDKCGIIWWKAYNWTGQNECITTWECYRRGGFAYSVYCVTPDHCTQLGRRPYIYGTQRQCRGDVPADDGNFDPEALDAGVYKCTDTLLDTTGLTRRCIQNSSCSDLISDATCVSRYWCVHSYYLFSNGSGNYCVNSYNVRNEKFCYFATKECNLLEPITSNNSFVEMYVNENKYLCHKGSILKVTETTAECVTLGECNRKQEVDNGEICHGDVCPERLVYDEKKKLCVEDCGSRLKYRPGDETLC